MLIAFAIGFGIVGYLRVSSRCSVFLSERTILKDAGAWPRPDSRRHSFAITRWIRADAGGRVVGLDNLGSNASRTAPTFNRDQNAIGTVKYMSPATTHESQPVVFPRRPIAPFDAPRPSETYASNCRKTAFFVEGLWA